MNLLALGLVLIASSVLSAEIRKKFYCNFIDGWSLYSKIYSVDFSTKIGEMPLRWHRMCQINDNHWAADFRQGWPRGGTCCYRSIARRWRHKYDAQPQREFGQIESYILGQWHTRFQRTWVHSRKVCAIVIWLFGCVDSWTCGIWQRND